MTAEPQYSAKETARRLGVSSGMLRRYAMALEAVTGETIRQHPRDGRQYTGAQVAALVQAKQLVGAKPGRDVETAVRMVLGIESDPVPSTSNLTVPNLEPELLKALLVPLVTPLLTEVQALRTSNERLLEEVEGLRRDLIRPSETLPPVADVPERGAQHGVLVRAALRLERLWRR